MVKHFISTLLILFLPCAVWAKGRILTVQSVSLAPYEEAIAGFAEAAPDLMERILLTDEQKTPLADQISRTHPDLILALGLDALKSLDTIHHIPIVFVMLLCPDNLLSGKNNITGVNMRASAEVQLRGLRSVLPENRRIGAIYNSHQTGRFMESAAAAAQGLGIILRAEPVLTDRGVPAALLKLKEDIDLLWMVPDITVMTSRTAEFFILFSMEHRIPLAAFSKKYLDLGALIAFDLDSKDMGRQAGEMAVRLLSGESVSLVPMQDARTASTSINPVIARKLGIRLEGDSGSIPMIVK